MNYKLNGEFAPLRKDIKDHLKDMSLAEIALFNAYLILPGHERIEDDGTVTKTTDPTIEQLVEMLPIGRTTIIYAKQALNARKFIRKVGQSRVEIPKYKIMKSSDIEPSSHQQPVDNPVDNQADENSNSSIVEPNSSIVEPNSSIVEPTIDKKEIINNNSEISVKKVLNWFRSKTGIVHPIPQNGGEEIRSRLNQLVGFHGADKLIEYGEHYIEKAWRNGTEIRGIRYIISCWETGEQGRTNYKSENKAKELEEQLEVAKTILETVIANKYPDEAIKQKENRVKQIESELKELTVKQGS